MAILTGDKARQILENLKALGPRKLGAMAIIGTLVVALVGLGAWSLSRPSMEVLYTGLDRQDVTRIGAELTEAGITFDVNAKGDTVSTPFSATASARMLLAEKGLPRSEGAGYELFDQLGSMGLTSFMQEVTRVRAMEGELARTIQTLKDVRAARVHIVLPEPGTFRRETQKPSASVVIRTDNAEAFRSADAIRHLVASAIPQMSPDEVTVLNTDGTLLASGDDGASASSTKQLGMEGVVSRSIEDSIRRTLAPYLGIGNFQSSVVAKLDTDRRSVNSRKFDPEGRVERSTRTVRETGQSNDKQADKTTTVEQNLPQQADATPASGNESSEAKDRREELTNYEINETTTQTVSDGYDVKRLSVAVVVNRKRLTDSIGADATPEKVDAALAQVKALVASAAGFSDSRGDQIEVTAVDFAANGDSMEPVAPLGLGDMLMRQSGTLINALTILVVAVLLIWFGLKPAIRTIVGAKDGAGDAGSIELANAGMGEFGGGGLGDFSAGGFGGALGFGEPGSGMDAELLEDLTRSQANSPQARLEKLVDFDEAQAASILRNWIHQKEAA
ncbi:flagellar basal-body MS-ring/collar protein FliF [Aureimonas leprariae]|uniref:Flagellar M-ring protein n=1 Tax=Plantimonas leprariae TaxID=2615207 RepID=A0A7V7TWE9_9HYPH|nr:flagellar basal-body MS-ring/collar protein FliF [Aureimonas leprariae]KAB0679903.1 flagellar M-ring protein FliF [Aureimonas leprariae]